jgi:uncharacterized protein (TIGR03382 family)
MAELHTQEQRPPFLPLKRIAPALTPALASTLALALTLAGCLADPGDHPRTGTTGQPIYNGQPDTAQEHMAVVAITYGPGTGYFCTGTLITQRVVLTAGHCVRSEQPQWLEIFFGNNINGPGDYRQVSAKEVHADFHNGQLLNDIAMLRLASDAPANVIPIRHLPAALELTAADVGILADFSGFGETENNTDGVKLHVAVPIGLVCPGPGSCTFNGADVNPWTWANSMSQGGACFGDSGGPAFVFRNGCEYVAGITSYGDAACLDYGVNTKVDAYQPWIDSYIQAAGVEDCTAPGDEDNDGVEECNDPDCACHPSCQADPEDCENGIDDDGDGLTDCADHECLTHPGCQTEPDGGVPGPDSGMGQQDAAPSQIDGGGGDPPDGGASSGGSWSLCGCRSSHRSGPPLAPLGLLIVFVLLGRTFRRSRGK